MACAGVLLHDQDNRMSDTSGIHLRRVIDTAPPRAQYVTGFTIATPHPTEELHALIR